jgi:hypothetical protein
MWKKSFVSIRVDNLSFKQSRVDKFHRGNAMYVLYCIDDSSLMAGPDMDEIDNVIKM